MTTNTRYNQEESDEIAKTIHRQITAATFMTLGASNLGRRVDTEHPMFTFVARIIPRGKKAPRKMNVNIEYLHNDLYRITVWYLDKGNVITHYEVDSVHVEDLNRELFALDFDYSLPSGGGESYRARA